MNAGGGDDEMVSSLSPLLRSRLKMGSGRAKYHFRWYSDTSVSARSVNRVWVTYD